MKPTKVKPITNAAKRTLPLRLLATYTYINQQGAEALDDLREGGGIALSNSILRYAANAADHGGYPGVTVKTITDLYKWLTCRL